MLTVVIGNLVALQREPPDDPSRKLRRAGHARRQPGRAELIRRLLGFARRQPSEPRPVEVNELILGMSKLIRRSLPSTIAVSTASREPCLVAMVDAHQLENALLNLALNARDAMPNGGELHRIVLGAPQCTPRPDLEVPPATTCRSPSPTTAWAWTAAPWRGSSSPSSPPNSSAWAAAWDVDGVWLHQTVGRRRAHPQPPGQGTTVALLLPRWPRSHTEVSLPAGGAVAAADLAGKLVLLAEDDADVRSVVRMQLSELGCAVVEAEGERLRAADMVENIPAIASSSPTW